MFLRRKIIQGQKEGKGGKRQIPNPGQSVHVSHRGEVFQHGSPSARAKRRSLLVQRSAKVPPLPRNRSLPPPKDEKETGKSTGSATSWISSETFPCVGLRSCSGSAFCSGLSARTDCEGAIGGVRGFPPVSIGTESHRGSGGGGAPSPVPAPLSLAGPREE